MPINDYFVYRKCILTYKANEMRENTSLENFKTKYLMNISIEIYSLSIV